MTVSKLTAMSLLFVAALAVPAAQAAEAAAASPATSRTYVSSKGADTAACSLPAPCRTLTRAHAQTLAGGEIVTMDSGSYAPVTITKTISIVNDGLGTASVPAPANGAAITINAGTGNTVFLRGLEIDGQRATQSIGIKVTSGNLDVVRSTITRAGDAGIRVTNSDSNVSVSDSLFSDSPYGIAAGVAANLAVDSSHFTALGNGVYVGTANASIKNSVFFKSGSAVSLSGFSTNVMAIEDCKISASNSGITNLSGIMLIGRNVVSSNSNGVVNASGTIYSTGTNQIRGNAHDTDGPITQVPGQ